MQFILKNIPNEWFNLKAYTKFILKEFINVKKEKSLDRKFRWHYFIILTNFMRGILLLIVNSPKRSKNLKI